MEISSKNYFIFFPVLWKNNTEQLIVKFFQKLLLIKYVYYKCIPLFITKSNTIMLGLNAIK